MKFLYLLSNYILWAIIIVFSVMNLNDVSHINIINEQTASFFAQNFGLSLPVSAIYLKTPVLFILLFLLGECAGITFFMPMYKSIQDKLQAYRRELEKGSITNSSSTSKIEVLENKISVLEKALEDALKKNNDN